MVKLIVVISASRTVEAGRRKHRYTTVIVLYVVLLSAFLLVFMLTLSGFICVQWFCLVFLSTFFDMSFFRRFSSFFLSFFHINLSLALCLSIRLPVSIESLYLGLPIYLFIYQPICLCSCLSIYFLALSTYLSNLHTCVPICPSLSLSCYTLNLDFPSAYLDIYPSYLSLSLYFRASRSSKIRRVLQLFSKSIHPPHVHTHFSRALVLLLLICL